jgi:hypothetical protein
MAESLLPAEIWFEVLSRVRSVYDLVVCRRVCRDWTAQLGAPYAISHLWRSLDDCSSGLLVACSRGLLPAARWLVATFGFTAEDARAVENYAFRRACEHGHLETAQWLVDTFGLAAEDARTDENYALHRAYMNDHLEVSFWLIGAFGLTDAEVRDATTCRHSQGLRLRRARPLSRRRAPARNTRALRVLRSRNQAATVRQNRLHKRRHARR